MSDQLQDKGLKRALSQKRYFLRFLKRYIGLYAAQNITENDLQLIDKSYIDQGFRKRESDIVYRVKNSEHDIIFYVILELQSKVDYTMPVRLLFYITELLRRIFNDTNRAEWERKDFRMPAVVPIILYTGDYKWTAERSYKGYTRGGELFEERIIDFQYSVLDLTELNSETLETGDSTLDAILLANKTGLSKKTEGTFNRIARMIPQIPREQWPDLMDYIMDVSLKILKNPDHEVIQQLKDAFTKGDVKGMEAALDAYERALQERESLTKLEGIKEGKREGIKEGKREGIQEGKLAGKQEGMLEAAKKLLAAGAEWNFVIKSLDLSKTEVQKLREMC